MNSCIDSDRTVLYVTESHHSIKCVGRVLKDETLKFKFLSLKNLNFWHQTTARDVLMS